MVFLCDGAARNPLFLAARRATAPPSSRPVTMAQVAQQDLCKACGAHRVLSAKGPATDPERKAMVLRAVASEHLSRRAAGRVFGVARQTIARWLGKKAAGLPPLRETLLPAEQGDALELDEPRSVVGCKLNARWGWIALGRQTRQVIACFVGDRSAQSARARRERLPPGHRRRAARRDYRLAAGRRRGLCPAHASLRWQGGRRDRPGRALERRPAPTPGPASCARPSPLPSASGCTKSPSIFSRITTTSHSHHNHCRDGGSGYRLSERL